VRGRLALGGLAAAIAASCALLGPTSASADDIAIIGGTDSPREIALAACEKPGSKERFDPARAVEEGKCPHGKPHTLMGTLSVEVQAGAAGTLRVLYLRDGAAAPIELPGAADPHAALLAAGTPATRVRGAVIAKIRENPLAILDAAELLGELSGRKAQSKAVASGSKVVVRLIRRALRDRRPSLDRLGEALTELIQPPGTDLRLDARFVRRILNAARELSGLQDASGAVRKLLETTFDVLRTRTRLNVEKDELKVLPLRFAVPEGEPLSTLDGRLFIEYEAGAKTVREAIDVKTPEPTLKLDPATLPIVCTWGWSCEPRGVTLTGTGVPYLVTNPLKEEEFKVMTRSDVHEGEAKLKDLAPDGTDPLRARATLEVSNGGTVGRTYKGSRALATGGAKPPNLEVEVPRGLAWWIVFLVIAAGVLVGQIAPRLRALSRRRRLLTSELRSAEQQYSGAAQEDFASYNLSDLLTKRAGRPGAVDELTGEIAAARNDDDLDEDTERVLEVIARIMRWLRVEPAALRLKKIVAAGPSEDKAAWVTTNTLREARAVLEAAHDEPQDVAAADKLVAWILATTAWYHRFRQAWDNSTGKTDEAKTRREALMEIDTRLASKDVFERSATEQAELEAELETLTRSGSYGSYQRLPTLSELEIEPTEDRPEPLWSAAPFNFRGWAPLSGATFRHLSDRARRSGRGAATRKPRELPREAREIVRRDWGWTLFAIVAAITLYMTTHYSNHWGSLTDFLVAFLAGFASMTLLEVAALPIFQSLRLRAKKS
jgi:hypothetical protein